MTKKMIHARNDRLFDKWSFVHIGSGIIAGWALPPVIAFIVLALWEPFEILILSPFLARYNIVFGHESLRNSLSDIGFNLVGVIIGATILTDLVASPF